MTAVPAPTKTPMRGRTRIVPRALSHIAAAVARDVLDVDHHKVRVALADDRGSLSLTVDTPISVVPLAQVEHDPGIVARTGGAVLPRTELARQQVQERVAALTGLRISRVVVRLTGVEIHPGRRVL